MSLPLIPHPFSSHHFLCSKISQGGFLYMLSLLPYLSFFWCPFQSKYHPCCCTKTTCEGQQGLSKLNSCKSKLLIICQNCSSLKGFISGNGNYIHHVCQAKNLGICSILLFLIPYFQVISAIPSKYLQNLTSSHHLHHYHWSKPKPTFNLVYCSGLLFDLPSSIFASYC